MENAKEALGKKKPVTSRTVPVRVDSYNKLYSKSVGFLRCYLFDFMLIEVYCILIQLIVCGLIGRLAFSKAVGMDPRMKLWKDCENVRKEYQSNMEENLVSHLL